MLGFLLLCTVLGGLSAGCVRSAGSVGESGPASPAEAKYYDLHGHTPVGTLTSQQVSLAEAEKRIRDEVEANVPVILPQGLPPGMKIAAPFRGTGAGSALPNPHIWGKGWALTFTDGKARLTVVVEDDQEFGNEWSIVGSEAVSGSEGRLEIQRRPSMTLVRFSYGSRFIVVIGERISEEEVIDVAFGMSTGACTG